MKFCSILLVIAIAILPIAYCSSDFIAGAPREIHIDQVKHFKTRIEDLLKNSQNDNDWIYVDSIKSATSQVVAGTLFKVKFSAIKTNCNKNDLTNTKEKCEVKENQNECTVAIWEKPWMNFSEIQEMDCMGVQIKK